MKVVIYESASFGGCYDYARYLYQNYQNHPDVSETELLLPRNSTAEGEGVLKMLPKDKLKPQAATWQKKWQFIWRNIASPMVLFFHLLGRPACFVLLNDFEQTTAVFWVPLYKLFFRKHVFAVFLHDPDRDAYPPSKSFSTYSMQQIMSLCKLGLYHEHLPEKPYYDHTDTHYMSVPHGIYPLPKPDNVLLSHLNRKKDDVLLAAIVGNIRTEKNYSLVIEAMPHVPNLKLLIAGSPASSSVSIDDLKKEAKAAGVQDRIIWLGKYLTDAELAACLEAADIMLLCYARSFTSQSGILNVMAPYKNMLVVSRLESSLTHVVERFHLGTFIDPDRIDTLIEALQDITHQKNFKQSCESCWDNYLEYASWQNQVDQIVEYVKPLLPQKAQ